jgi:hypothetical protein
VVTLEISDVAMLGTPTGRVQIFEGSLTRVLAQGLPFATGLTQDPVTGDILVLTLNGAIYRFSLR